MKKRVPFEGIIVAGIICFCASSFQARSGSTDLNLQAQLVWGTNKEKPDDPNLKEVDPIVAEKLRKVFKWKNYFLVNRQKATIPSRSSRQIELSKKCTIEVTELAGPEVEVTLIGEGKLVNRTRHHLARGEYFTIGGGDKNGCAWFIIVTELDEK